MNKTVVWLLLVNGLVSLVGCRPDSTPVPPPPWMRETNSSTLAAVTEAVTTATIPLPTETPIPTELPSATTEPMPTASETPAPASTIPTESEFTDTTAVPTVDPFAAAIQIFAPGPMSKVSSPIDLRMYIAPRATGLTIVELFGEDGRLMARNVFRSVNYNNQFDKVIVELPFETNAAAELGRLQVSTKDDFGMLQAVKSVHLMLLSVGDSIITKPEYLRESVALSEPPLLHYITGGEVSVQGNMQYFNDMPVILELVSRDGQVVGSRIITTGPTDGKYYPFDTDIPYTITNYTPARLVIRQSDNRIPGAYYLYSQELYLSP